MQFNLTPEFLTGGQAKPSDLMKMFFMPTGATTGECLAEITAGSLKLNATPFANDDLFSFNNGDILWYKDSYVELNK